jgi:hypothetical protein
MALLGPRRTQSDPSAATAAGPVPASPLGEDGSASLRRRRDELVSQVAELHWDLGGLAYEMAIRDHFRLDVLVRKASELQERDAELGELERVLSLRENAGAGQCPNCAAVRSRGAVYCWQCGHTLMERTPSAAASGAGAAAPEAGGGVASGDAAATGADGAAAGGHGMAVAHTGVAAGETTVAGGPRTDADAAAVSEAAGVSP